MVVSFVESGARIITDARHRAELHEACQSVFKEDNVIKMSTKVLRFADIRTIRMTMDKKDPAHRISISLPRRLAEGLDEMVQRRGFHNRSQAIAEMVEQQLIEFQQENDESLAAGTITLFYDASKPGLLEKLARIEREHIDECISSQHVLLEGENIMEVVLVQGRVQRLREITDRMLTCKGVNSGKLTLTSKIIPQVQER